VTIRQQFITTLARLLRVEPPVRLVPEIHEVRVPRPADPVEMLETLHDAPDRVYVWICRESTTDDQIASIAESIGQRGPKALHVVCRDIAEIRKLSPEDIRRHLAPIVKRAEEGGWQ
jgi:hypothetical protein